ncbi:MAG: 23S rRNA (pseudouridine(1915)-N(3))-methyltransferase RlmH [Syntrophobacterales bacterium]|jgi:23S rRNA (pseudouridine1915-N3)-methyltransferase|nr:23S rRNA (pseudouridine(1915)-N(3))-methyltransferase RlmH [Syntrophobacterales bacterium]
MLHITLVMAGKTRQEFIRDGLAFYGQRLKPYLSLTLTSVREEHEAAGLTPEALKAREGVRLRAKIPPRAWVAALTPQGREYTSEAFAAWLTKRELESRPLAFLIGGHLGLDPATLAAAQEQLALSQLTLTHELSRLVLLEQLYRAMTIKCGHPYHV